MGVGAGVEAILDHAEKVGPATFDDLVTLSTPEQQKKQDYDIVYVWMQQCSFMSLDVHNFCLIQDKPLKHAKGNWTGHAEDMQRKLKMPVEYTGWSNNHCLHGVPRTERDYNSINTAHWAFRQARARGEAELDLRNQPVWFCDCTQGVESAPWHPKIGTQAMSSKWYSFQRDRVLNSKDPRGGCVCVCVCVCVCLCVRACVLMLHCCSCCVVVVVVSSSSSVVVLTMSLSFITR